MEWPSKSELEAAGGSITQKVEEGSVTFSLIKAYEARNADGSPSGWKAGTPEGERDCIEKETRIGRKYKYSNRW